MSTGSSSLHEKLSSHFKDATHTEYWHYLAKNRLEESIYLNQRSMQERVDSIRKKLGTCSFDCQAAYGWTPLHVAVLSNNKAAVNFFLEQGAKVDIPDENGKTAMGYADRFPKLMDLFSKSQQVKQITVTNLVTMKKVLPKMDQGFSKKINNYHFLDADLKDPNRYKLPFTFPAADFSTVEQVLRKLVPSAVSLPSSFVYQEGTNDFGVELQHLLFSDPHKSLNLKFDHLFQDISGIADREGFQLTLTTGDYYPRDSFIRIGNFVTTFVLPNSKEFIHQSIEKAMSKAAYFGESASFCARVKCLTAVYIGTSVGKIYHQGVEQFSSFKRSTFPVYIEGGNLFTLTNKTGKRKILIGKDHLAQIHANLRLDKYFDLYPPAPLDFSLSDKEIRKFAEEMYAMGLLRLSIGKEKKSGYISRSMMEEVLPDFNSTKDVERLTFRKLAIEKGLTPFSLEEKDIEEARPLVEKYVAQRKAMKEALAKEFEVMPEDLHFIPQLAYHLDVFLQPGPKGSIFLQDFSLCKNILEQLNNIDTFFSLCLGPDDRFMLARYLASAEKLEKELGPLLIEARNELEKAGFIVIPTPGIFFDLHEKKDDRTYHLNFLNAITGWSEKQKHYFYVATGASVGTHLGALLMKLFERFLEQYETNSKIYFVGENPKKEGDFSQVMDLWNQTQSESEGLTLGPMAGAHCLSFEKAAKSHQHRA